MVKVNYKVTNNFTGRFTVALKGNPFRYKISKLNATMYRVRIYLTDSLNTIGTALIKNDLSRHNALEAINLHRENEYDSLIDYRINKAINGLKQLTQLNLNKIIHNGSKFGAIKVMTNKLYSKQEILYHTKKEIQNIKFKLRHIKENN